jgi:hypothetical protein
MDDLKNDLMNTKEKVWSLEVTLQEVEAGGQELTDLKNAAHYAMDVIAA